MLPKCRLYAQIEKIVPDDTHMATQKVCSMLSNGIAAIFGPQSQMTRTVVQSICDTFDIPHIGTGWDYRMQRSDHSLNVFPYPGQLSEVNAEIIKSFDWWKSFAILYENSESLARLQDIIKLGKPGMTFRTWQLHDGDDYRSILREIEQSGEKHIVIDCSIEVLPSLLKQAQQVGIVTNKYEYFITNLDLQTIDPEDFQYSSTNITGVRLLKPSSDVAVIVSEWNFGELQQHGRVTTNITEKTLKTDAALMYDAVMRFALALKELDSSDEIRVMPLSCDGTSAWSHGISLINFMKGKPRENIPTLTGLFDLDVEGFWRDFYVDVIALKPGGFIKIGYWKSALNITWPVEGETGPKEERIVYNVSTKFGKPYFWNKTDEKVLTGNERYEGYVVDLMDAIAEVANFSYRFIPAPDNEYGNRDDATGEWSGVVGEILKGNAQIGVCDLTITSVREEVVDFTTPFMNLGISLLFKAKEVQPPALFSFLDPFSPEVWLYMAVAYIGVSLILFVLARFSPYEWDNPYPCIQDPDTLENNFTLLNSMWFTIGTLMQQGSDVAPRAPSTRIVASLWSFFTLIIISSYTANLATFLVVQPRVTPIEFIEDLPTQTKIKYGCGKGGSTRKFFLNSNVDFLKQINNFMEKNPSALLSGNEEGVNAVKTQDYAFFMESTSIDYVTSTNCGLRKVTNKLGQNLDSKGYGIAVSRHDPLRNRLTSAILKLQEEEVLQRIWKRWWEEKASVTCDAQDGGGSGGAKPLTLENVGGVFVVLISGMGLACIMATLEFLWNVRKSAKEGKGTFCSEFMSELRFVIQCHGSTKPIRKTPSQLESDLIGDFTDPPYSGFHN